MYGVVTSHILNKYSLETDIPKRLLRAQWHVAVWSLFNLNCFWGHLTTLNDPIYANDVKQRICLRQLEFKLIKFYSMQ